ncbi:hypothetical protein GJ496_009751 [Pomphorhynchus laevis]|nr:hypothetical protein GJ496_009751 [Pomphorhynchus laevis]
MLIYQLTNLNFENKEEGVIAMSSGKTFIDTPGYLIPIKQGKVLLPQVKVGNFHCVLWKDIAAMNPTTKRAATPRNNKLMFTAFIHKCCEHQVLQNIATRLVKVIINFHCSDSRVVFSIDTGKMSSNG